MREITLSVFVLLVSVNARPETARSSVNSQLQSQVNRFHIDTSTQTNWRGAIQLCQNQGRQLASVQSWDDNMQILQAIGRTNIRQGHFWTAGTDEYIEGMWIWETTRRPFSFTYWHFLQPDNFLLAGGENCMGYWEVGLVLAKGYKWNDRPCDYSGYAICEGSIQELNRTNKTIHYKSAFE